VVIFPEKIFFPTKKQDLEDILNEALANGKKIRPISASLCYTEASQTTDYLVVNSKKKTHA
jgi:FAD/FMN-containing dehydrogenase